MAKSKDSDAMDATDEMGGDDRATLPPLRDSLSSDQPAADQAMPGDNPPAGDARARDAMSDEDRRREEQRQREEQRKDFERMAMQPNKSAMKWFVVRAADEQEPPFHFSSTPTGMLVWAEREDYARRLARAEMNDDVWEDETKVVVEEVTPDRPMVVSRDFHI